MSKKEDREIALALLNGYLAAGCGIEIALNQMDRDFQNAKSRIEDLFSEKPKEVSNG